MPYIGNQPFGKTVRTVTTETIASAKTAYYPNGGYMAGYVDVFVNGVRLSESLDFTATDGSLVTLLYTPNIGDTVEIVTYGSVEIANAVRRSGDTFSGNVYVGSNVYISTSTISVGNATVNTQITAGNIALNGSTLTIGNSTVNTVFTGDTVTVGGTLSLGNTAITGTANVTTAINVGANVSMNATSIRVGNSTINTYIVSDTIYGPSTLYIDPAAAGDNTGLVVVKGDLQVDGTTFTINSANVTVNDKNVVLASGAINNAATDGAGLTIYGTNANLTYNATGNNFEMSRGLSVTGTANVSVALNVGANVNLSTSQINVGNSTVNTVITSTSLSTNGITVSGGTANGVAYLNSSKVLTTGSALTFDGTTLTNTRNTTDGSASTLTLNNSGASGSYATLNLNAGSVTYQQFSDAAGNAIGTAGAMFRTTSNHPLIWGTNNTERMRLDSSGNLLVGTASLASGFSTYAQIEASANTGGILINSATGNIGRLMFTNNNASGNEGLIRYDGSNQSMQFWTSAQERMRIDSSGRFGVGANSLSAQFHVQHVNGNSGLGGNDDTGMVFVESTNGSGPGANNNASFVAKNRYGWGQVMQWENYGMRIGNRGTANSGAGAVYFTYGQDSVGMTLAGGNLGIGVTPSAWYTVGGYKSIEIARAGNSITSLNASDIQVRTNSYLNSSGVSTYANAGFAANYEQYNGAHYWYTAPSGTAGNPITFTQAMTLQTGTYGGPQLLLATTTAGNAGTSGLYAGSRFSSGVIAYSADAFGCIRIQDTGTGTNFKSEWGLYADSYGQPFTTISFQTGIYFVTGDSGASAKIAFDTSGNAYKSSGAGSWSALSDSRIKTNVQTVTNGLSRILQLNPVTFDYKSPEAHNGKVHDKGFIADEFMVVYPDSVTETEFVPDEDKQYIEEGSKAKAMGFNAEFYADLVSAIQEQQALITQLTARITALDS